MILNSPLPSDRQKLRDEIDNYALFDLYGNSGGVSDRSAAESEKSFDDVPNSVNSSGAAVSVPSRLLR